MNLRPVPIQDLKHSRVFFSMKVPRGGTAFLYTLVALLIAATVYAVVGTIDEWARGTAILRPEGDISIVRNEMAGRIASRPSSHGQRVAAGEVLWTVDTGVAEAEIERMEVELERLRLERAETEALVESLSTGSARIPIELSHARVQYELLRQEQRRLELQVASARRAFEREDQAPASLRAGERVEELRRSYDMIRLEAEQHIPRELVSRRAHLRSLESQISDIESTLVASQRQRAAATVRAPIQGVVEYMRDLVPGDFVSSAEELARIVPDEAQGFRLVIEVPEREASGLEPGQELVLRFSGFPVAQYGSLRGRVSFIPQDAEVGADGTPVFRLRGTLEQTVIYDRSGQAFPLRPGMTAEARVITRQTALYRFLLRRLDFLL